MRFRTVIALALLTLLAAVPATYAQDNEGVKVPRKSVYRYLFSADKIEQQAGAQYAQMMQQAAQRNSRAADNDAQLVRLRRIAQELLPGAQKFNERAKDWKWDVNLLRSNQINAFCMPGGKIAFFTGILQKLQLSDDEVAIVMGHEIAHALREHSRARAAKSTLTSIGTMAVAVLVGGNAGEIARMGGGLLGLKFSRNDETEADLIGMELAARAGYDPSSGVHLWEKMSAAAKGAPMEFMSTHPSGTTRISTIKANLKDVMPLYERAKAKKG